MKLEEFAVRPLRQEEYGLLENFLYDAIFQKDADEPLPRDVIRTPEIAVYINDFGKPDDYCLTAESNGMILGAVWTRILAGKVKGYGNIDAATPEFAITVKEEFRGQGIGTRLMQEMILLLKEHGYRRASLSVDKENYAYRMYGSLGFQTEKEHAADFIMVLELE